MYVSLIDYANNKIQSVGFHPNTYELFYFLRNEFTKAMYFNHNKMHIKISFDVLKDLPNYNQKLNKIVASDITNLQNHISVLYIDEKYKDISLLNSKAIFEILCEISHLYLHSKELFEEQTMSSLDNNELKSINNNHKLGYGITDKELDWLNDNLAVTQTFREEKYRLALKLLINENYILDVAKQIYSKELKLKNMTFIKYLSYQLNIDFDLLCLKLQTMNYKNTEIMQYLNKDEILEIDSNTLMYADYYSSNN